MMPARQFPAISNLNVKYSAACRKHGHREEQSPGATRPRWSLAAAFAQGEDEKADGAHTQQDRRGGLGDGRH